MVFPNPSNVLNPGRLTFNRKSFLSWLTLALILALPTQAGQQDRYYVFNGKALQPTDGNITVASTVRWEVWFFEEGAHIPLHPAGLQYSRWGLIEANSRASVMRRLNDFQSFELAYLNFFGRGTWGRYTFLNPVGPIAVTGEAPESQPAAPENRFQLWWLDDVIQRVITAIEPSLENNESDPASPLRIYFDQVRDAQQQLCKLYSQMSHLRPEPRFVNTGIARAKTEIKNVENNVREITAVLPTVRLPASKAWMSYSEWGGSDGMIQVDVTETEGGLSVQRTWSGGDGSMTGTLILTKIPYRDIGKINLEHSIYSADEWRFRVESATGSFPETITSPLRKTARRTLPAVYYETTAGSAYFSFRSSKQAQDAYAYFLYHKQVGR
jgi:hypothetical protein